MDGIASAVTTVMTGEKSSALVIVVYRQMFFGRSRRHLTYGGNLERYALELYSKHPYCKLDTLSDIQWL
jgi:hypothetical protein